MIELWHLIHGDLVEAEGRSDFRKSQEKSIGIELLQGFEADDVDAASGFGVLLTLGKIHVVLQRVSFLCCHLQPLLWPSLFSSPHRNDI